MSRYYDRLHARIQNDKAFLKFLEQQPEDATYNYVNGRNCAIAQYVRSNIPWWKRPFSFVRVGTTYYSINTSSRELPYHWDASVTGGKKSKFSNAAKKLREYLSRSESLVCYMPHRRGFLFYMP